MRVLVIMKANAQSEAGEMPSTEILEAMTTFNEALVQAGVMLDGAGLKPSSEGARVRIGGGGPTTVIDGPFAETKELIAGYWVWKVDSWEDALDWAKKIPGCAAPEAFEVELRRFFELEDFGDEMTPELRAQEEDLMARVAAQREGSDGRG